MFEKRLKGGQPIVLDGGLATELESQGLRLTTDLWSAAVLKSNPKAIVAAHRTYLEAGADCVTSASYQASRKGFMTRGSSSWEADQLIASSVALAKQARNEFVAARQEKILAPLVAASVGPYGATLHDGSEYTGAYDLEEEGLLDFHRDRLTLLDRCGADVLACETIPSLPESRALANLLRDVDTPAWISFSCRDSKHICDGTPISDVAELFRDHPKVLAVGVNCTQPEYITSLIGELKSAVADKAIVVYPNSGEAYEIADNSWHGFVSPESCATTAVEWQRAGAQLIGGCCRVGPDKIRVIRESLSGAFAGNEMTGSKNN
jgi:homocysteine S-methyltransferase